MKIRKSNIPNNFTAAFQTSPLKQAIDLTDVVTSNSVKKSELFELISIATGVDPKTGKKVDYSDCYRNLPNNYYPNVVDFWLTEKMAKQIIATEAEKKEFEEWANKPVQLETFANAVKLLKKFKNFLIECPKRDAYISQFGKRIVFGDEMINIEPICEIFYTYGIVNICAVNDIFVKDENRKWMEGKAEDSDDAICHKVIALPMAVRGYWPEDIPSVYFCVLFFTC